jgi:tetratricopeptide (TPR) repeat protein
VLYANGEPIRAASAFGLASQILARAAGIRDTDGADDRRAAIATLVARDFASASSADGERSRMREILGEICGVVTAPAQASPAMRAARADLSVMADALAGAWTAWIGARAARAPVLVVLEDVHWADAASLRVIEAATAKLADRPLFVLGTARPEGSTSFADRFRAAGLVELTLARLSVAAAERLVRGALGARVSPELVSTLVRRAGGHPFHLEELVRAVADGRGPDALPDSVLGTVQARLDDLGPAARRLLRAASVFGETFRPAGVAALMGDEMSEYEIRVKLGQLVEREIVTEERNARWHDAATHSFRHILFRDVAYATLTDVDCVQAHRRAAMWLEEIGETDPAVLGEHYERGGAPERAVGFFHRAAAQALQRNDFERARDHAQRALGLGPEDATEAALRAIEAEILYWRGEITTAAERAPSAIARLGRGTTAWFDAISVAAGALGQLGRNDEVAALLRDAAKIETPPESREAHVVALCRGMTQLSWAHAGAGLADVRACLDALVDRDAALDAYPRGWVHRVRGEAAWLYERDVGKCLAELDASCAAFEDARAIRPLCLSRLNAASLSGWSGDPGRGLDLVAAARADAERLASGFLLSYGRAVEGLLLAYAGDPAAEALMRRALAEVAGSPRLAFICHFVLASSALAKGDLEAAGVEIRAGEALRVVDDLRGAGLALASRLAIARGDRVEAVDLASRSAVIAAACPDLELTFGASGLALAEAHAANDDRAAARAALDPVAASVAAIAATIPDPAQRARYVDRPLANDRIARLARDLAR